MCQCFIAAIRHSTVRRRRWPLIKSSVTEEQAFLKVTDGVLLEKSKIYDFIKRLSATLTDREQILLLLLLFDFSTLVVEQLLVFFNLRSDRTSPYTWIRCHKFVVRFVELCVRTSAVGIAECIGMFSRSTH